MIPSKCPTCGRPFQSVRLEVDRETKMGRLVAFDRCEICLQKIEEIDVEDFICRWKWLYDTVENMVNSGRLFPVEGDNLLFSLMLGEDNDKDNPGPGIDTNNWRI